MARALSLRSGTARTAHCDKENTTSDQLSHANVLPSGTLLIEPAIEDHEPKLTDDPRFPCPQTNEPSSTFPSRRRPVIAPPCDSMGGPCWDEEQQRWRRTFEVSGDGKIVLNRKSDLVHVEHLADGRQELGAALNCVGQFALAAGRLYCEVCCKTNDPVPLSCREVVVSGFWLKGGKFVTCSHFLDSYPNTNVDETERRLHDPTLAKACVSTAGKSQDPNDDDAPVYHVRLLTLCRASDLAIFVLNAEAPGSEHSQSHPKHFIDPRHLEPLTLGNDVLSTNYFAAYYPDTRLDVRNSTLSYTRKMNAEAANIEDACEFMDQEIRNAYSPRKLPGPLPHYDETFISNTRSVAVGRVMANHGSHICGRWYGSGKLTEAWDCNIPGFWGSSGGMVCKIEQKSGSWKARVIGLFHGESANDPKCNAILAFTDLGIDELRKPYSNECRLEEGLASLSL